MNFSKITIASIISFSAVSAFAWTNMPDICLAATAQVEANSPAEIIRTSLEAVGTGVQDPNLDRNKNFTQQEDAFIKTWDATEASFYYGAPKADKAKKSEFLKAASSAFKSAKTKEQKIFLLGIMQNCPGDESLATLQGAMKDKDKDIADAARMALQMNPNATKILANGFKSTRDNVLKSGIMSAFATRAFDSKKVPPFVLQAQNSEPAKNINYERAQKNLNYCAAIMAGRNWYKKGGIEEFAQNFNAKPDRTVVRNAIASGDERELIFVAPFVFSQFTDLGAAFKERYEKCEGPAKAWLLTAIATKPTEAGRDFIIEALKNTKDEDVRRGGAWALAEIGDEPSAMAIIDLHKACFDDGQMNARSLAEYAIGAAKANKNVDKAIYEGAKKFDRSALRLVAARGVYEAFPFAMDAIKQDKERGDACWVLEQMGTEKDLIAFCEFAIQSKDNWLFGRIMPLTSNIAKRIADPAPVVAKLEQLKAKADAEGLKAPWDRAIELVNHKGVLPKKR